MAQPQYAEGSKFEFLGIQVKGRALQAFAEPNIRWRDLLFTFYYGPQTDCDAEPNGPQQKFGLVTASGLTGAPVSVPNLPGSPVVLQGFMTTVMTPLLNALSIGWVNNGILTRWIDTPTDPWQAAGSPGNPGAWPIGGGAGLTITTTVVGGLVTVATIVAGGTNYNVGDMITVTTTSPGVLLQVTSVAAGVVTGVAIINGGSGAVAAVASATVDYSYSNPTGDGAVGGNRLPLDNNVIVRRYTEVRGKSWRGNVRPCPIAVSQVNAADNDQLSPAAAALWKLFGYGMYTPITDGNSILWPLLVSVTESQLIRSPTVVAYAPLVLPGLQSSTGIFNPIVDLALGESRRRKEKKTVVV